MTTEKVCRLCGSKSPLSHSKTIQELKNEQLDILILQYFQIKMHDNDGFPNTACTFCCKTLYEFDQFAVKVNIVQKKFQATFLQSEFTSSTIKLENGNLLELKCNEIESNHIKTESIYVKDYDDPNCFLNDFSNELENSNLTVEATDDENIGTYSQNLTMNSYNIPTIENLNENNDVSIIQYKCYKCDYMVRTAECLQDHFKLIHNAKPEYVCVVCNALFDNLLEFECHEHSGKQRKVYSCEFCGKQFYNSTNIKAHRNLHLGIKPFECEICGKKFRLKRHKDVHKITVCSKQINDLSNDAKTDEENEIKPNDLDEKSDTETKTTNDVQPEFKSKWKCEKCDEYFYSEPILQNHIKNVHEINNPEYNCADCFEIFQNIDKYEIHLQTVHNISKKNRKTVFQCSKCLKLFTSKTNYRQHLLIHSGLKKFPCNKCGKKFTLKNHLVAHSLTHVKSPIGDEVKCNQCDKKCKNSFALALHHKSHMNKSQPDVEDKEKESICDQCGKVFKNKHQLKSHLRSHSDEFPFKCDQCPKAFKNNSALKNHKYVHTGETRYECEICGKKFAVRSHLTTHSTVHTKLLPFECNYCYKRFKRKEYLTVHLRQHTGERPYSCTECNHHFASNSNFIKHLRGKHKLKNFSITNQRQYPFAN